MSIYIYIIIYSFLCHCVLVKYNIDKTQCHYFPLRYKREPQYMVNCVAGDVFHKSTTRHSKVDFCGYYFIFIPSSAVKPHPHRQPVEL